MSAQKQVEEENMKVFSEEEERRSIEELDLEEEARREAARRKLAPKQQAVPHIPEVVDDFLRNFLRKAGLTRTLASFESEWYGSAQKALRDTLMPEAPTTGVLFIPDAPTHGQLLRSELERVRRESDLLRDEVLSAGESLARMQTERAFHRQQYRQVAEDKNRLIQDFKQLRRHLESYEPALRQLSDKYQAAMRQKMLISLEKSHVQNAPDERPGQEKTPIKKERGVSGGKSAAKSLRTTRPKEFPTCSRAMTRRLASAEALTCKDPGSFSLSCSIRAHKLPISCISLHPQQPILASASDDRSWRLWMLPSGAEKVGQMMLTGEGHSDWLSSCCFHPDGSKLATTSGDATVRLWNFSRGRCVSTLSGHSRATWGCSFHSRGHLLASCSADGTAKLWDLSSQRCGLTLRRHTASVSGVCFLPSSSSLLLTCSADKSLALWDARLGVCAAVLRGHLHPCTHAAASPRGDAVVASCDSRGVVKLWDVRRPGPAVATADAGPHGANQVAFGPSGRTVAVAGGDGSVRLVEAGSCAVSSLSAHSDDVQSVTFDHRGDAVMSAGSDGLIHVWSEGEVMEERD